MPRLENWSCTSYDDGYTPPEHRKVYLTGNVYSHPNFEGKKVTCQFRMYELGEVDPDYLKFLSSINRTFDPANPIRMI